nr:MAG TPA: hypothetical protein [Caudoviricetes sp.]
MLIVCVLFSIAMTMGIICAITILSQLIRSIQCCHADCMRIV